MTALSSTPFVSMQRDIEICPYAANCRYAGHCSFQRSPTHYAETFGNASAQVGKSVLGAACLAVGAAMTLTLWLLPLGIPLALIGIAFLQTAKDRTG